MNWSGPEADELAFCAFGSPPLSAARMESPVDMQDHPKDVELRRDEWRSSAAPPAPPREPIFGAGALPFLGQALFTVAALGVVLGALMLAGIVKNQTRQLLYGETAIPLPPISNETYRWSPETGLVRTQPQAPAMAVGETATLPGGWTVTRTK